MGELPYKLKFNAIRTNSMFTRVKSIPYLRLELTVFDLINKCIPQPIVYALSAKLDYIQKTRCFIKVKSIYSGRQLLPNVFHC
jgi:hypothetical protein